VDFYGYGLRVPAILTCPYAKAGTVDHTRYDFTSVLRTIETVSLYSPYRPAIATQTAWAAAWTWRNSRWRRCGIQTFFLYESLAV